MKIREGVLTLACIATLFGAACGTDEQASTDGAEPAGGSTTVVVSAANFAFSPTTVPVEPGAEIELTFENQDSVQHSFTAEDLGIDLVVEGAGSDSATFTAPDSGGVEFICKFHDTMSGTITTDGSGAGGSESGDSQDLDY